MRATPTFTYAQSNNGTANEIEWTNSATTGVSAWGADRYGMYYINTASSMASGISGQFQYTADAEL